MEENAYYKTQLAVEGKNQSLKANDYTRHRLKQTLEGYSAYFHGIAISVCGKMIVSASWDNTINTGD